MRHSAVQVLQVFGTSLPAGVLSLLHGNAIATLYDGRLEKPTFLRTIISTCLGNDFTPRWALT